MRLIAVLCAVGACYSQVHAEQARTGGDSVSSSNQLRAARALLESGHVIEAEEGAAGLEKYFLEQPDLVFLDLTMRDMYGLDEPSGAGSFSQ